MGNRKKRTPGPQHHAEGQHGERTHARFLETLSEGAAKRDESDVRIGPPSSEGHRRLHEDRQQHDEAEKGSEKVEIMREEQRGKVDETVLFHIPHESDSA